MFNFLKKKKAPVEQPPKTIKVGKANITVMTIGGITHRIPITGDIWQSPMSGKWFKNYGPDWVFNNLIQSKPTIIKLDEVRAIPVNQIKTINLEDIDEDFEMEIPK